MPALEVWELFSYVVTVVGLPLAIVTYWQQQRKERENEDEDPDFVSCIREIALEENKVSGRAET